MVAITITKCNIRADIPTGQVVTRPLWIAKNQSSQMWRILRYQPSLNNSAIAYKVWVADIGLRMMHRREFKDATVSYLVGQSRV